MSSPAGTQKRRLLFITQWFPPEPAQVPLWIASALRERGWVVEVLTGHPNYPNGKVHEGFDPRRYVRDEEAGFHLRRTPLYPSHDQSAIRRMANYISWALSASVVAPIRAKQADVTLVYSSPATAAAPAMLARLLTGRRYVLLVQDIWPDSVTATGLMRSGFAVRVVERLLDTFVKSAYRGADFVLAIAPGARDLLVQRGVPEEKVRLAFNWADEDVMHPRPPHSRLREQLGLASDDFLLMYAGTTGPAQGLETAIDALQLTRCRAHLAIVGDGISKAALTEYAHDSSVPDRVHFFPPIPVEEIADLMAGADAQLVSLTDHPLFEITLPSKVQGILATGSICIASAPGDAAKIVQAAGGQSVRPDDPHELASAIDAVAALDLGSRAKLRDAARRYYQDQLSEDVGAAALSSTLDTAANNRKGYSA